MAVILVVVVAVFTVMLMSPAQAATTDGSLLDVSPDPTMPLLTAGSDMSATMDGNGGVSAGQQLLAAAQAMKGTYFGVNGCTTGVCKAFSNAGMAAPQVAGTYAGGTNLWVPNWAAGVSGATPISSISDLQPGDVVVTQDYIGPSHIGIYAGNGQMWNDSTSANHTWSLTGMGNFFQGFRF